MVIFFQAAMRSEGKMTLTKGLNMVFERSLVFKIRATNAIPNPSAVLLMGSPIPFDGESLATFSTHEGLDTMLPLVVGLEGPKVLEMPRSWVLYVVLASWRATIAWEP